MENFGIRTAIVKEYNAAAEVAKEMDVNNLTSIPTAFTWNGDLNVSVTGITNSVSDHFKISPEAINGALTEMKNEGILNINLIPVSSGMTIPFVTINDTPSTDEELDSFRTLFTDKAYIK